MQLLKKLKNFFRIFCCIYEIYMKSWTFWKKGNLIANILPNFRIVKDVVR